MMDKDGLVKTKEPKHMVGLNTRSGALVKVRFARGIWSTILGMVVKGCQRGIFIIPIV